MSSRMLLATAVAAAVLGGCSTRHGDLELSPDPNFGEAHRYNAAIQTIDPAPVYEAGDAQPGDHGEKAAAAVERYRTDRVKDVEIIQTTTSTGGSGNGPQ